MDPARQRLSVRGLSIALKERILINEADLSLSSGEALCLLGRNGSGKSTLMRVMAGLQQPSRGKSTLYGAAGKPRVAGVWGGRAGVQQKLSVLENITYFSGLNGVPDKGEKGGARLLKRLELWEDRHKLSGRLSSGFKMRLAIAIALVADPDVLFLDEPDSNVDAQSLATIISLLNEYKAGGGAVVCASHEPQLVLQIADLACRIGPSGEVVHIAIDELRAAGTSICYRLELSRPAAADAFSESGASVTAIGSNTYLLPNCETDLARIIERAAPYGVNSLRLVTNPIERLLDGGVPC